MSKRVLIVVACLAALAAIGSSAAASQAGREGELRVTSNAGATPVRHEFPAAIRHRVRVIMRGALVTNDIPGAIVGVWTPNRRYVGAFGTTARGRQRSWLPSDRTRIGSLTKTFTATIVLQLVDEGKLKLRDTLADELPQWETKIANADEITVRELLNMTSGIPSYTNDEAFGRDWLSDPTRRFTPSQLIGYIGGDPPLFPPGARWEYSNTNTILLGQIIEARTGRSLRDEIRRRIVNPLGLRETALGRARIAPPHVHGYLVDARTSKPRFKDVTSWNPSWAWAAGAVVSSLRDLRIYVRALGTGQLLAPRLQRQRLQWVDPRRPKPTIWTGYGLGIGRAVGGFIGHNGELPGFNSIGLYSPRRKAIVVILLNTAESANEYPSDYTRDDVDGLFAKLRRVLFPSD